MNKPIFSICTHSFSDAPLGDVNAYDDYYRWVVETIALAQADNTKYWLIKQHPQDGLYNQTGAFKSLRRLIGATEHLSGRQRIDERRAVRRHRSGSYNPWQLGL